MIDMIETIKDYWAQITVVIGAFGYILKLILNYKIKKQEIRYNLLTSKVFSVNEEFYRKVLIYNRKVRMISIRWEKRIQEQEEFNPSLILEKLWTEYLSINSDLTFNSLYFSQNVKCTSEQIVNLYYGCLSNFQFYHNLTYTIEGDEVENEKKYIFKKRKSDIREGNLKYLIDNNIDLYKHLENLTSRLEKDMRKDLGINDNSFKKILLKIKGNTKKAITRNIYKPGIVDKFSFVHLCKIITV